MKKKKISNKSSVRKKKTGVKPAKKSKPRKIVAKKKKNAAKKVAKKTSRPVAKKAIKRIAKKVAKPAVEKSGEEFPGYPHYPPSQDIMNPKKGFKKNELTESARKLIAQVSPQRRKSIEQEKMEEPALETEEEDLEEEKKESDLDRDEKKLLEADELSEDMGEDEELRSRVYPVDMSAEDLDVPGTDLDDEDEELGEEDEENNPYSIGGDRHEDMDEKHDPGR